MKRSMGLLLIIAGAVMLVCGIVMVCNDKRDVERGDVVRTSSKATSEDVYSNTSDNAKPIASKIDSDIHTESPSQQADVNKLEAPEVAEAADRESVLGARSDMREGNNVDPVDKKTKTSKEKGDEFEDFTVNLLADWRMRLLRRTQDKMSSNGVVAESCKEPDLHIEQKRGNSKVDYHLECKYRSRWIDNAVTFDDWQIKRYREFQKARKRKVLIALGVGGSADKPQTFMIVPIDSIKDNAIRKVDVNKFGVTPTSDGLASYIEHYFDEVFAASRKKKKE